MKFRIITNGLNFRVQWLGRTWLLRRLKWYWLLRNHLFDSYIPDFDSEEEAKKALIKAREQFDAKDRGYKIIVKL